MATTGARDRRQSYGVVAEEVTPGRSIDERTATLGPTDHDGGYQALTGRVFGEVIDQQRQYRHQGEPGGNATASTPDAASDAFWSRSNHASQPGVE